MIGLNVGINGLKRRLPSGLLHQNAEIWVPEIDVS